MLLSSVRQMGHERIWRFKGKTIIRMLHPTDHRSNIPKKKEKEKGNKALYLEISRKPQMILPVRINAEDSTEKMKGEEEEANQDHCTASEMVKG
jgi:hypothetical protein